ncbi:phage tail tape measure protein [Pseudobacillus badius]|uniref:phage tail tape measure protein n=1 Tax=Bacillus badius TaxID=1455 RepID=UPI0007B37275|nr:phage tail tape measure protein [Bacillus badius]KZR60385.1 hypothetical protein A3781_09440 [Bacillus badius]
MADIGSLRVSLGINSVDFTRGMQDVNRRLRALDSEFKALTAGAGRFDNSLNGLRSRSDVLSRSMQTHRAKVEELRRQYEESARTKGEDAAETQNLLIQYNRAVTAMGRTENQLRSVNQRIQEQSNSFNQLSQEVNSNVDRITREMRVLESGFDAATAGIRDFGNTTDQLQQRSQHLTSSLQLQERRVEELQRLYREAARSKGEDAQETQELLVRYNRATQAMRDTERQLRETNHEIEEQTSRWGRLRRSMRETEERAQQMGGRMQSVGSDLAGSFGVAGAAIGAGLGFATKKTMDFEAQLSAVKAVSGATTGEMKQLKDLAIKYGADTKYSGLEAAQGIEELIKAGVSLKDIINGGLEGALSLATAGELELADAAEVASTALNAFKKDQLTVSKAADLLAGGANASATSVEELKYGLSQVSAVASGVGLSFKDTTTTLSVFAQKGLKGSDAGTSLKTMLMRLSPTTKEASEAFSQLGLSAYNTAAGYKYLAEKGITPAGRSVKEIEAGIMKLTKQEAGANATKSELKKRYEENLKASGLMSSAFYDEKGQLKSMSEIAGLLQNAMKGLNDEQRQNYLNAMFGADAIRAGNILYKEGAKGVTDMYTAMSKVTAVEVANEKMNNLKGQIEELSGAFETAQISIGNALAPALSKVVGVAQKTVDAFNNLSPKMQATIAIGAAVTAGMLGLVAAVGVTLAVVGQAVVGFGAIAGAIGAAGGAAGVLAGAMAFLTGPIGLGIIALAGLGVAAYKVSKEMKKPTIAAQDLGDKVSAGTKKAVGAYLKLDADAANALSQLSWSQQTVTDDMVKKLVDKYAAMGDRILTTMQQKQAKQLEATRDYFAQSSVLSDTEELKIVEKLQKSNETQQTKIDQGQARIKEILTKAKEEKRALAESERLEINKIQDQMRVTAVQTMSKGEVEQKAILERLKNDASIISATQAAQVVANSIKQKEKTVKEANEQYKKSIAEIIRLRDESGVISAEQATKLISEAKKQRDGAVNNAEDMHKNVVKEAQKQAGEQVNQIDWTTGQVKTKWQAMKDDVVRKTKEMSQDTSKFFSDLYKDAPGKIEEMKSKIGLMWDDLKTKTNKKLTEITTVVRESGAGMSSAFQSWQTAIGAWLDTMPGVIREKLTKWSIAFNEWIQKQNEENKRQYGEWWNSLSGWFTSTAEKIPQKLEEWKVKFSNWFTETQSLIGQKLEGWWIGIGSWFTGTKERIYTSLGGWGTRISEWFTETKNLIPKKLQEWWTNITSWITGKYNGWTSALGSWTKSIGTWFSELPGRTSTAIGSWWTSIKNSVVSLSTGWKSALDSWWTEIKNWFSSLGSKPEVKDSGKKLVNKISEGAGEQKKSFMDNIGKIIVDGLKNVAIIGAVIALSVGRELIKRMINGIEEMHGAFKKAWDSLLSLAAGKLKEMAKSVSNSWSSISKNTSEMISGIKKTVSNLWEDIVDGAKKLPGRIGSGISKMAGDVTKGVKDLVNKLGSGLENGLNLAIKGLNKVLKAVGVDKKGQIDLVNIPKLAKGTDYHPGGLAIVGDGGGPELIRTPDGKMKLSPGTDTLVNLPKGSKVLPHRETKSVLESGVIAGLPKYAEGVGDWDIWDFFDKPKELVGKLWNDVKMPEIPGMFGDFAKAGLGMVKDHSIGFVKDKLASLFNAEGFTGGMEKDPGTVGPGSGMGGMMKYVEHWYNQVKDRFGKTRFMGGYSNRGVVGNEKVKSMHSFGRAFDIGGSHSTMSKIAEYLRTAASNLQYVIYNHRIAGPGVGKPWRTYNGKNKHTDHVHADFKAATGVGGGIPGGKISGNLSSWISAAMSKAGVSGGNWLQGLAWIINKESSGRPGAVGAMTSTGTAKGLMQLKDFNYKGNPFDPVNNIFYGIKYILGRYKSIEGALSWWKKHNWYEKGTDFHPGGPAVVNDGKGPELIQFPTGQLGMFKGKNVLADLPRGTKVMPHEKTKELVNAGLLGKVPNYAAGVGDLAYIVKAGDTLSKIAKQFKTTVEELVKLNNIKDKNKIQVGQRIVYGKGSNSTLMTGQNSFNMGPVVPSKPPVDTRPQYAKDVTYLMGKAAKEEDAQLAKMKKELNNKLVEFEKEKAAKIKEINEKAVKYNQQLLEKEKERDKKIKAINDKAAKSKRGLTTKEKEQVKKIRADYDKAVNSNKDLTKKQKDQIKKINDDYAKKERAAVNTHNKQISEIEKAAQQKRMQEIDAYVARKKEAGKLSLYDEIQVYRESMRHYKKNSEEWFAAEQKLNQAKVQMHNELKALKDDYLAKVKEVNQRVIDEEKRLNAEYEQELENRINNIKGSFGLFDEVAKPEEEIDPDSLIKKLHSQVYALNNWRTNLDALANRGIDKGLLEELQAMGPQALAEIKALNDMTDTQLNQFQGLWKDKTEAARLQATKELTDLKEKTLKQIELLHRDAEKELDELNKTFTEKATELRTGAINEFQPFGAQLKDIGTNAIKGLMDGMTGMTGALEGKMKEISKLMVDTMKKALEIKSPSRLAKREIAGNYGLGLIGGLNEMKSPIQSKINEVSGLFNRVVPVPDIPMAAFASGSSGAVSYDQSQSFSFGDIIIHYSGDASREDVMAMADDLEDELTWRFKSNNIVNGVRRK